MFQVRHASCSPKYSLLYYYYIYIYIRAIRVYRYVLYGIYHTVCIARYHRAPRILTYINPGAYWCGVRRPAAGKAVIMIIVTRSVAFRPTRVVSATALKRGLSVEIIRDIADSENRRFDEIDQYVFKQGSTSSVVFGNTVDLLEPAKTILALPSNQADRQGLAAFFWIFVCPSR